LKILIFGVVLLGLLLLLRRFARPAARTPPPHGPATGSMQLEQARAVLGLEHTDLDAATVIAAHRRLMQRVHPDKGGSALLAQQLNEAKRVLLADIRSHDR
jgi:hypothetical protein